MLQSMQSIIFLLPDSQRCPGLAIKKRLVKFVEGVAIHPPGIGASGIAREKTRFIFSEKKGFVAKWVLMGDH